MKIYIIGAGTIGKALAVCLKLNGKDVQLIRGSTDDGRTYTEKIKVDLIGGSELVSEIQFSSLSNFKELDGLIVLTNKSFGNKALSEKLRKKAKGSPIVLLQNGLGVAQPFIENDFQDIYRCVLFVTSQNISKNEIRYKAVADSPIGIVQQNNSQLETIVIELDTPNFSFASEGNIQRVVWKKTIANCVFNSICPLLEVDNGIFHRDPSVFALAKRIIKECVHISKAMGIDLEVTEIEKQVLMISQLSDGQFISTLQDIRNKKETEIDTLNLEIYRLAKTLSMAHLVPETKVLGDLIKLKSELNR